jgi:hypothetical protein
MKNQKLYNELKSYLKDSGYTHVFKYEDIIRKNVLLISHPFIYGGYSEFGNTFIELSGDFTIDRLQYIIEKQSDDYIKSNLSFYLVKGSQIPYGFKLWKELHTLLINFIRIIKLKSI